MLGKGKGTESHVGWLDEGGGEVVLEVGSCYFGGTRVDGEAGRTCIRKAVPASRLGRVVVGPQAARAAQMSVAAMNTVLNMKFLIIRS